MVDQLTRRQFIAISIPTLYALTNISDKSRTSSGLVIVDENYSNPFPPRLSLYTLAEIGESPVSTEGYAHNAEKIEETVRRLANILQLKSAQRTLDVGYGSNLAVMETFHRLGLDSYGLDSQDAPKGRRAESSYNPPKFNAVQNGIKKYWGTIEELLNPESELNGQKFDLFVFWGSWDSGGNNWAIGGGEMGWFRAVADLKKVYGPTTLEGGTFNPYDNPEVNEQLARTKDKILEDCRASLNPNGGILIVSSRYAYHGAGFAIDQLPLEKRVNLRIAGKFADLGAREIYLFGLSKDEVQRQLAAHPQFTEVSAALTNDQLLFGLETKSSETPFPPQMLKRVLDMKVPLGRIDAVYARF